MGNGGVVRHGVEWLSLVVGHLGACFGACSGGFVRRRVDLGAVRLGGISVPGFARLFLRSVWVMVGHLSACLLFVWCGSGAYSLRVYCVTVAGVLRIVFVGFIRISCGSFV